MTRENYSVLMLGKRYQLILRAYSKFTGGYGCKTEKTGGYVAQINGPLFTGTYATPKAAVEAASRALEKRGYERLPLSRGRIKRL